MKKTLFPAVHGYRVGLGVDLTEKWDQKELREIMYRLAGEDADSAELLLESCNPEDADDLLNPGTEMVLEAVTAVYSRLGKTAAALARVFARHLPENLTMDGDPFVGPNRKNALFAYKTVTLRISDGQTVSILFHSPDNDPRKFQPDETLVAYRWMLNKKDITATVAPERGRDITLQLMARRMAQLVEANSDKFQKQQAAREALEQELVEATARREDLRTRVAAATEEAISLDESLMAEERRAVRLADQLEEQRARNERLKADAAEIGTEIEAVTKTNESPDDNPEMPGGKNYNIYEPYYKEAIEKGLSPLSPSEFMDEINSGNQNGFSLDKLKQDLAKYRQMLIDLRDKKITPRSVAGVGASQKGAANWIKGRIEQTEQDITTGGIGNHVNAANYRGYLARLIREASESPDDSQELPSGNENNETNPAQPPSLADLDASLASSVARSLKNIAAIDSGAKGMDRALFVANLASKIKTRAKRGDNDVADAALRMVAEFNSSASKPALTQRNSVWSSTGKSYKDYAVSGITAPQQESVAPDKPASTEGFGVQPFLDARTRIAAALAEELAMAGFDPHNFPVNDPEYVLSEYAAIATEKTLSGTGAVYLNALDSLNSMTVEMEFNEDAQPGQSEPIPAVRETLTIPVPVGILESKFDSLVSQIEAFFAGFRSPLDDIQLPKMGEKISSVNQNDAADIAKAIRKDIKEILQPSGWKPSFISVKTSKYSMGQSISVTIRDVPEGFRVMAAGSGRYTTEMRSMIRVLEAIGNAYRYDNSDSQTDYFDTNFYYSVSVDPDLKQQIEDQVAKVDAVHKFNATDEFKTFVAAYVDKGEGYNPFETAKGADIEAAKHGATISWLMDAEGGAIGKVMRAGEEVASLDMGDDGKIAGTIASGTRIMFTFTDAKGNASPMMVSRSDEGAGLIKTLFTDQANGLAGDGLRDSGDTQDESHLVKAKTTKGNTVVVDVSAKTIDSGSAEIGVLTYTKISRSSVAGHGLAVVLDTNKGAVAFPVDQGDKISEASREFKKRNLDRAIPGLSMLRSARSAESEYQYKFSAAIDRDDPVMPEKPSMNYDDLAEKYPVAKTYLKAEGFSGASNYMKSAAGEKAMRLLEGGGSIQDAEIIMNNWLEGGGLNDRPAQPATTPSESEAIAQELQALLNETDADVIDQQLDSLAARAEKAGAMDELDGLLNQVADRLTDLIEQEDENA